MYIITDAYKTEETIINLKITYLENYIFKCQLYTMPYKNCNQLRFLNKYHNFL